jgi:hypothetical protein
MPHTDHCWSEIGSNILKAANKTLSVFWVVARGELFSIVFYATGLPVQKTECTICLSVSEAHNDLRFDFCKHLLMDTPATFQVGLEKGIGLDLFGVLTFDKDQVCGKSLFRPKPKLRHDTLHSLLKVGVANLTTTRRAVLMWMCPTLPSVGTPIFPIELLVAQNRIRPISLWIKPNEVKFTRPQRVDPGV